MSTFYNSCVKVSLGFTLLFATVISFVATVSAQERPNVIVILTDDMGFSDIGTYGGEIQTPAIDALAANGLQFRRFYNTAKCSPTRAALLTGQYPHAAGMEDLSTSGSGNSSAYLGYLSPNTVTMAEALKENGYRTYMSGKWHIGEESQHWPTTRGFDHYWGLISGANSYFELVNPARDMALDAQAWDPDTDYTAAIAQQHGRSGFYMTDATVDFALDFLEEDKSSPDPFFLYMSFTAPHFPLHALEEDISKYDGVYDQGWDLIRAARLQKMISLGIVPPGTQLSPQNGTNWSSVAADDGDLDDDKDRGDYIRRMQIYAAQVDRMDQAVGKLVDYLQANNMLNNTLILFMSDNGGSAEDVSGRAQHDGSFPVGDKETYLTYLQPWGNASNTPFRQFKNDLKEGGIATPLVAYWPAVISGGAQTNEIGHVKDIMATVLDVTETTYPTTYNSNDILPLAGESFAQVFDDPSDVEEREIFWEYSGERAVRNGKWKAHSGSANGSWTLYDMVADPVEDNNLANEHPTMLSNLSARWDLWEIEVGHATGTMPAPANAPIVANPIVDQEAGIGAQFLFSIPANTFSDDAGDLLLYEATLLDGSPLPEWLHFEALDETFSGVPAAEDLESPIEIELKATDWAGNTVSDQFSISAGDIDPFTGCPTFSTLPCDQITLSSDALPYNLDFNATAAIGLADANGLLTGFTMADAPSVPLATPTNENVPGYEPTLLAIQDGQLQITTTAGIAYVKPSQSANTNSQVNALGVGLTGLTDPYNVSVSLIDPLTGTGNSEQGGIWFGLNEDNYLKFNLGVNSTGSQLALRSEANAVSVTADQVAIYLPSGSIAQLDLRLFVDPVTETVTGFYTLDGAEELTLGSLDIPSEFFTGTTHGGSFDEPTTFTGVYATHRNGTQRVYTFDDFSIVSTIEEVQPVALSLIEEFDYPAGDLAGPWSPGGGNNGSAVVLDKVAAFPGRSTNDKVMRVARATGGAAFNYNATNADGISFPAPMEILPGVPFYYGVDVLVEDFTTLADGDSFRSFIEIERADGSRESIRMRVKNLTDQLYLTAALGGSSTPDALQVPASVGTPHQWVIKGEWDGADIVFSAALDPDAEEGNVTWQNVGSYPATTPSLGLVRLFAGTGDGSAVEGDFMAIRLSTDYNEVVIAVEEEVAELSIPYRINVAGGEVTVGGELYVAEDVAYLTENETTPTQASVTSYDPNPGNTDLYFPRRFGPEFGYHFPVANGEYRVLLHMVENYQTTSGNRVFDVDIEGVKVEDDIDLFVAAGGKGNLYLGDYPVIVEDGILDIDFLGSVNFAIVQAIEILEPAVLLSGENDIISFVLPELLSPAQIDAVNHTVTGILGSGSDISSLAPVLEISASASVLPGSGDLVDFSLPVEYIVTAEDGTTQAWTVDLQLDVPSFTGASINFQDEATVPPSGYLADYGEAYDDRGNGFTYGWIDVDTGNPISLVGQGRNRDGVGQNDPLLKTLIHMNHPSTPPSGYWEIEVPDGTYEVSLSVGEPVEGNDPETHRINAEGVLIIDNFVPPTGTDGSDSRHSSGSGIVEVLDGKLTLDYAGGGFNTKPNYVVITPYEVEPELTFSAESLVFELTEGETTESQIITLSANTGNPENLELVTDPESPQWLILPSNPVLGEIEVGIDASTLVAGVYNTSLFATANDYQSAELFVSLTVLESTVPACSPLSTLDCEEIPVALPYTLSFDGTENGLADNAGLLTGFTMVDSHSEARMPADGPANYPGLNGYEPSRITLQNGNLTLAAAQGIAYLTGIENDGNNTQINTLGVGLQDIDGLLNIETTLLGITTGTGSAQAGIWFGVDEDNYVKLNINNNNNIELRTEIGGVSAPSGEADQLQIPIAASGKDIKLRLEIDPVALLAKGYYSIDGGPETLLVDTGVEELEFPSTFISGKDLVPASVEAVSFAGIYASYRKGSPFNATFDNFSVSEEEVVIPELSFTPATLDFQVVAGEISSLQSLTLGVNEGTPSDITLSSSPDATSWLMLPVGTIAPGDLEVSVDATALAPGVFSSVLTASAEGFLEASTTINVEVLPQVVIPCSPLSTLPCEEFEVSLPFALDFNGTEGGLAGTGFTMVDAPSARLAVDDPVSNPEVPGFEPGLLAVSNDQLLITATKGIMYRNPGSTSSNTNSQLNALGAGFEASTGVYRINTTLVNPAFNTSTGNQSQQAGIWFGLDEDNYIKLAVLKTGTTSGKVQLLLEDHTTNPVSVQPEELNTGNVGGDITQQSIQLELEINAQTGLATGYYSLDGGATFTQVTEGGEQTLPIPDHFLTGLDHDVDGETEPLSFAGLYGTIRNAGADQQITYAFEDFLVENLAAELASLEFTPAALDFEMEEGGSLVPKSASLSTGDGETAANVQVSVSEDWVLLPTPAQGILDFGIEADGLEPGIYQATVTATADDYQDALLTINLEVTGVQNSFTASINFQDPVTTAPNGYLRDSGEPYGLRDAADQGSSAYFYGWLDAADGLTPLDLSLNGANRERVGIDLLQNTFIHMQYGDTEGTSRNQTEGIWEIDVPNGSYRVTVIVGDEPAATNGYDSQHSINVEGVPAITTFQGSASQEYEEATVIVNVVDGRLTLDADGGTNTKPNSVVVVPADGAPGTPLVLGVFPADGATNVAVTTSVSANELYMPNGDEFGVYGILNSTITDQTVKLVRVSDGAQVPATVNGTGGGDAINLSPTFNLQANTQYSFEIEGVTDITGVAFEPFSSTFTTGSDNSGGGGDLDQVAFTKFGQVASGAKYTTLVIGPDNKLYGLTIGGVINRWTMEADGTLSGKETINTLTDVYGNRSSVGLVFDPDATSGNLIAYITHCSSGLDNAPEWDGKLSRLSGANLENEDLIITNLPRSKKDHLTNSMAFRPGEPNVIYFNQGSNSAGGAPDNAWGNRLERLLSAAVLRLDLDKLAEEQWPLDAMTTMDGAAINSVDVNSATLDGMYNPYYINAPLTLFATGVRNAYDLAWHSNGQLYVPTNGTAGGSNTPASIDDTRRPDGSFYDHDDAMYPVIPAANGNNTQRDWLFRIDPTSSIGYYGHPNPLRGEFVLNRGTTDVNNYPVGIDPDPNYRGAAFDFELNKSPNGVIEYRSNAEGGNLKGALLVTRYSGGSDLIALVPDGPGGDILTSKVGIPGFTNLGDPLDLVEDVQTGNIYVSNYGGSEIVLLKPSNQAAPTPVIAVSPESVVTDRIVSAGAGDAITIFIANNGNGVLNNISVNLAGTDAGEFLIDDSGLASSLAPGASTSVNISFDPSGTGSKSATLFVGGTDAETASVELSGLGRAGSGGTNEPSLQYILDTYGIAVDAGDENPATNIFDLTGLTYNDLLGDEVSIPQFERASDANVELEVLAVFGPEGVDPIVGFGWYESGNALATHETFTVSNAIAGNGQTLNPQITGSLSFDPGLQSFGFYNRWPNFSNRHLYSEDALNSFGSAIPHHVRVYELPGEENAYIIATEEHISGFDYQDVVVVARNIQPAGMNSEGCSPITTLDCEDVVVDLPFNLDFSGSEGGLANTGFTMVDAPSARIAEDGSISNVNVPGFEPSRISFSNGQLVLDAAKGIAYRKPAGAGDVSENTNSQINTLGAGFQPFAYGNFNITTTIIAPYQDGENNSEQAGIWFGLNEDNFIKLVASNNDQVELRIEEGSNSATADGIAAQPAGIIGAEVALRLFVDTENGQFVGFYSVDGGTETQVGSIAIPSSFLSGTTTYGEPMSFAGVFASKRNEDASTEVLQTFEDFAIIPVNTPEPQVAIRLNTGGTAAYTDAGGNVWELDAPYITGSSLLQAKTFDVGGTTEDGLFLEYRYGDNTGDIDPGLDFGYEIPVEGTGPFTVNLYLLEPYFGVAGTNGENQGGTGQRVFSVSVESGQDGFTNFDLNAVATPGNLVVQSFEDIQVNDGNLSLNFSSTVNNAIVSAIEVVGGGVTIDQAYFTGARPADNATGVPIDNFQITANVVTPIGYELDKTSLAGNVKLYEVTLEGEEEVPSNSNDTGGGDAVTLTPFDTSLKPLTEYVFRITDVEANLIGDLEDRITFLPFESRFTTGQIDDTNPVDLTGVTFTQVMGEDLGEGIYDRFSSLVVGPDGKLYASTTGEVIKRWDINPDGTLTNLETLTVELTGSDHPETGVHASDNRLIIGFAFAPEATAENLVAYVTHSALTLTSGPEWDGKLTRLSGPDLASVEDIIIHLPRSQKDHLTNSVVFGPDDQLYIVQGSNSAGGETDPAWGNRPERLLAASVLEVELDKMPAQLPLDVYTTDDISVINSAPNDSYLMSDGTYNPYSVLSPVTLFSTGIRNAYDAVWHSNGYLYVPTNGTAGNNNNSPNTPASANYAPVRRPDGTMFNDLTIPGVAGGETQKDWLFKAFKGSYHGHPNPYRGEFVLNHGGLTYNGLPGQTVPHKDVNKYPSSLAPDPDYVEPAYDFGFNKSPNGALEYKSNAFGGKLKGMLMVVRFSGQDDIIVMQPGNVTGDIVQAYPDVPGLQGFDDPLEIVEDPATGNIYLAQYDRDGDVNQQLVLLQADEQATPVAQLTAEPAELIFETTTNGQGLTSETQDLLVRNDGTVALEISSASLTGAFGDQFSFAGPNTITLAPGESTTYSVTFEPGTSNNDLGFQDASLDFASNDGEFPVKSIGLYGLKKSGYEGGSEPPLQDVVNTLGIGINVGWTNLANGVSTTPQGEEVIVPLFVKAGSGEVGILPVARYSPAEALPFGWYTNVDEVISHNETGVLDASLAQAQTLYPEVSSGAMSFNPQGAFFGIYVESNTFKRNNYTEDDINTGGVARRARIYPMKDRQGAPIANSYLVTFEDASNGDYQDYVFILSNVRPYEEGSLLLSYSPASLNFMASTDEISQIQSTTLSANTALDAGQVSLSASEPWVVLPGSIELGSPIDFAANTAGLAEGVYQATVTASAPGYGPAILNLSLTVTGEMETLYRINFQDDSFNPPSGYAADAGLGFGDRGNSLFYGWVQPGTNLPVNHTGSARGDERDVTNASSDSDKLFNSLNMFDPVSAEVSAADWEISLPNGTYFVELAVGDPGFTDSRHSVRAEGVEVISNFTPTAGNLFATGSATVVVNDGRLTLDDQGGDNTKINYVVISSISEAAPNILGEFEGIENTEGVYRGEVLVSLSAESPAGNDITTLEYSLDGGTSYLPYAGVLSFDQAGSYALMVHAVDDAENETELTFNFTVEEATGALVRLENMNKMPQDGAGTTDIGFPANDYYVFHRASSLRPNETAIKRPETGVMRVFNEGVNPLVIGDLVISDLTEFVIAEIDGQPFTGDEYPITVASGSFVDVTVQFVENAGSKGLRKRTLTIQSNADNSSEGVVTLSAGYMTGIEGNSEITAHQVMNAFGFTTSMNGIDRPSSDYPLPADIDAGIHGDLILSEFFVQADLTEPIRTLQLSALHGPGGAGFSLSGTGISHNHGGDWHQSLMPRINNTSEEIAGDTGNASGTFRIEAGGYTTSGSGGTNSETGLPTLLGIRVYKAIDRDGELIPNAYIVVQDYIGSGCGEGSANCDWNDNMYYITNIKPAIGPSSIEIADVTATVNTFFTYAVAASFDKGYAGNALSFSAELADGSALPSWLNLNAQTAVFNGIPGPDAQRFYDVEITATDLNGVELSETFTIDVLGLPNSAPIADGQALATAEDTALDIVLTGSDEEGDPLTFTVVEVPSYGQLSGTGANLVYTPDADLNDDANGEADSFTFVANDGEANSVPATVSISVSAVNDDPSFELLASSVSSTDGQAQIIPGFALSISDGDPELEQGLTFSLSSTNADLFDVEPSIDANGELTFTPAISALGTSLVSVTLQDDGAPLASTTQSFSIVFSIDGATDNDNDGFASDVDCDDNNPDVYPGAPEICDNIDNNCDGSVDEGLDCEVFELRLNAGGPAYTAINGDEYVPDDVYISSGNVKTYSNPSVTAIANTEDDELYLTERAMNVDNEAFTYSVPVPNGIYEITFHFAEIYHGAPGGGNNTIGARVFDVLAEGNPLLEDYDVYASAGGAVIADVHTFSVTVLDEVLNIELNAVNGANQPKISAIEIVETQSINNPPVALATADPLAGFAPLQVTLDAGGSSDDEGIMNYTWSWMQGGLPQEETGETVQVTFPQGVYDITLTIEDAQGETDTDMVQVTSLAEQPDFALRLNGGGGNYTALNGDLFVDDTPYITSGNVKTYSNTNVTSIANTEDDQLYLTERAMNVNGGSFSYGVDVPAGVYTVRVHLAEIYFGAPGSGSTGGVGSRVFDVSAEGNLILDNYDIVAMAPGAITAVIPEFTVPVNDGTLDLVFSADPATGGVNQPKVSGIEILSVEDANQLPVAALEADPIAGIAPLTVTFDGSASTDAEGDIIDYMWSFGDPGNNQISGTLASSVFTYTTPGIYTATLTVTDEDGSMDTESVQITVLAENVDPIAQITAEPLSGVAPLEVSFDGTLSSDQDGSVVSYAWDFGDAENTTGSGSTTGFTYEEPGTYTATLVVTDNLGATGEVTVEIVVEAPNAAPVAALSATPVSGTAPLAVTFNGSGSVDTDGEIVSYAYQFGDAGNNSISGSVPTAFFIYDQPGTYTATLLVTDNEGATDEATVIISVAVPGNELPEAVISATPLSGTAPLEVDFSAAGSGDVDGSIVSYAWSFGDGANSTATGTGPSFTYQEAGDYTATLTVTDNDGGTDLATINISVAPYVPPASLQSETGVVASVGETWQTISLSKAYSTPVIVATLNLPSNTAKPAVTRIRNVTGTSFELRVQSAGAGALSINYPVHYMVVEEGTYTVAEHGIKLEAKTFTSTLTAEDKNWSNEPRSFSNSYANPVVLGQVMSWNDDRWSVFWASDGSQTGIPTSSAFGAGKHVGEDPAQNRANETLGYIVFEAGTGSLDGTAFEAGVGTMAVRGPDNISELATYPIASIPNPGTVALSAAGMIGAHGGWPALYGATPVSQDGFDLVMDEDQAADSERSHTQERIAYVVFGDGAAVELDPVAVIQSSKDGGYLPLTVSFSGTGSYDPDGGNIASYNWDFGFGGNTASGPTSSFEFTEAGLYVVSLTVQDDEGVTATATKTITVSEEPSSGIAAETGNLPAVGDDWVTVNLQNLYVSPVVVATVNLPSNTAKPAVTRVRNAIGNSFEVKLQFAGDGALGASYPVHYVVVEEGVYTQAQHGLKLEAKTFNSTSTANDDSWTNQPRSYSNIYSQPVVLGQVMSANDADWSVFWASDGSQTEVPTSALLGVGKHVGEDPDENRANETIGYIVLESGTGILGGKPFQAGVGAEIVRGPDNISELASYGFSASSVPNAGTAVLSAAGMIGTHGGWPALYGASPIDANSFQLVVDEDQSADSERAHTYERVAYAIFSGSEPTDLDPIALATATPESGTVPLDVSFDASSSYDPDGGSIESYSWNFGDGSATSDVAGPSHTYTQLGNFTATLTVTDDEGATDQTTIQITVTDGTIPEYSLTLTDDGNGTALVNPSGSTFEEGTPLSITATPSTGYSFVAWEDGSGNVISTQNPYFFPIEEDVTLHATFTDACSGIAVTKLQLINAATDEVMEDNIPNGYVLDKGLYPDFNIVAITQDCDGKIVRSVYFVNDGKKYRTESTAPYAMGGDNNGDFMSMSLALGDHVISATPYTGSNAKGAAGQSLSVQVTVIASGLTAKGDKENGLKANPDLDQQILGDAMKQGELFELRQNYPNPVVAETTIEFYLPEAGEASILFYSVDGRQLLLLEGDYESGFNQVRVQREYLQAQGSVFYQLIFKDQRSTKQMILK